MSETNSPAPKKEKKRALTEEKRFGKAYDSRLVKRLAVFFKPHRSLFFLALLSYPIVSGFHLLQPYLVKVSIDEHLIPKEMQGFSLVVAGLVGAILLEFIAKYGQTMLTQHLGQRVTRDLRNTLFHQLQTVDLAYIERNPVGRLMTRVTNDVESLQETFSTGAISIIGDIVTLVGIVGMMLYLDWRLTLYAFAILPILTLFVMFMRKRAREAFREVRTLLSKLNAFLNEAISGVSLIQSFCQEKQMLGEFGELNGDYKKANYRAIRYDATTYAIVEALATTGTACLLILGLNLFAERQVEVGVLVAFVDYLRRFFAPITELSTKYTLLQSAMASAERCVDLLDQKPAVVEKQNATRLPRMEQKLSFEKVEFSYGEENPQILHGLDLSIHQGEKVAIVGPTGAGKSTLVKLIARFYDPNSGQVTIDGADIRDVSLASLRDQIAVVLQDPYLFDGSIQENIAFGHESPDPARLEEAARRTCALEVIERQSDGWNTKVGDRGSRLSGGERQLVAFARALAQDPEILILDEATSSVDPETEALVQQGLEALIEGRTALIIAHRLSTIRRADRIVVLSEGRVVEQGSHDELLAHNGVYRRLYELQFENSQSEAA